MLRLDSSTGKCRSWATLTRNSAVGGSLFILNQSFQSWKQVQDHFIQFVAKKAEEGFKGTPAALLYQALFELPASVAACVSTYADQYAGGAALTPELVGEACRSIAELPAGETPGVSVACGKGCKGILTELESTPLYRLLLAETTKSHPLPLSLPNATMLVLCVAGSTELPELWGQLIGETVAALHEYPELNSEVQGLGQLLQLATGPNGSWRGSGSCGPCC